ncbi:NAD(P)/FAD-dependent oxidoreductase [Salinispira pacifica]
MKDRQNRKETGPARVVIVGAGIAGFTAAKTLAEAASGTRISLVNGEDRLPYKRTKISKNMVRPFERDAFALAQEPWYHESGIELLNGRTVSELDSGRRLVRLDDGREIEWDALIIATGSEPERLDVPGAEEVPVHTVRRAADVERMLAAIADAKEVLVIGGGVLGVEVCEQLARMGRRVTFCVSSARVMARQLNGVASADVAALLERNGVVLLTGTEVRSLAPARAGALGADRIAAEVGSATRSFDAVVACVGVKPDVEIAERAGIRVRRGIVVNQYLETSAPGVFAAGDAAEHAGGFLSYLWHAAEYQGELAARNAAVFLNLLPGQPKSIFDNPPFRLKCEVFDRYYFSAGILPGVTLPADGATGLEVSEERADGGRYRCLVYRGQRLVGVIMINDHDRAKIYQKAVREGWSPERMEEELQWN